MNVWQELRTVAIYSLQICDVNILFATTFIDLGLTGTQTHKPFSKNVLVDLNLSPITCALEMRMCQCSCKEEIFYNERGVRLFQIFGNPAPILIKL